MLEIINLFPQMFIILMAVMGAVLANPAAPYASHYQPKVCQWSNYSHSKTIIWKSEREKEKKNGTFLWHVNYFLRFPFIVFLLSALDAVCLRVRGGRLQGQQFQPQGTLRWAQGSGFLLRRPPWRPRADCKFVLIPICQQRLIVTFPFVDVKLHFCFSLKTHTTCILILTWNVNHARKMQHPSLDFHLKCKLQTWGCIPSSWRWPNPTSSSGELPCRRTTWFCRWCSVQWAGAPPTHTWARFLRFLQLSQVLSYQTWNSWQL